MIFKASKYYAAYLQLNAALVLVALSFLTGMSAAINVGFAAVFGALSLICYIFTAVFYIWRFAERLSVRLDGNYLIVNKGVITARTAVLPVKTVRFFELKKTPLSGLFGICSVAAYTSSGRVMILGLDKTDADTVISCTEEYKLEQAV